MRPTWRTVPLVRHARWLLCFIEMLDRAFEMAAMTLEGARLDLLPLEEHPLAVVPGFKGAPWSPALFLTEIQARAP